MDTRGRPAAWSDWRRYAPTAGSIAVNAFVLVVFSGAMNAEMTLPPSRPEFIAVELVDAPAQLRPRTPDIPAVVEAPPPRPQASPKPEIAKPEPELPEPNVRPEMPPPPVVEPPLEFKVPELDEVIDELAALPVDDVPMPKMQTAPEPELRQFVAAEPEPEPVVAPPPPPRMQAPAAPPVAQPAPPVEAKPEAKPEPKQEAQTAPAPLPNLLKPDLKKDEEAERLAAAAAAAEFAALPPGGAVGMVVGPPLAPGGAPGGVPLGLRGLLAADPCAQTQERLRSNCELKWAQLQADSDSLATPELEEMAKLYPGFQPPFHMGGPQTGRKASIAGGRTLGATGPMPGGAAGAGGVNDLTGRLPPHSPDPGFGD